MARSTIQPNPQRYVSQTSGTNTGGQVELASFTLTCFLTFTFLDNLFRPHNQSLYTDTSWTRKSSHQESFPGYNTSSTSLTSSLTPTPPSVLSVPLFPSYCWQLFSLTSHFMNPLLGPLSTQKLWNIPLFNLSSHLLLWYNNIISLWANSSPKVFATL